MYADNRLDNENRLEDLYMTVSGPVYELHIDDSWFDDLDEAA